MGSGLNPKKERGEWANLGIFDILIIAFCCPAGKPYPERLLGPRFAHKQEGAFMAGLKDKRGFIDKERLDLTERKAMEYWMKRWGVTREQLTAAHRKVGRLTKDIASELGKKR